MTAADRGFPSLRPLVPPVVLLGPPGAGKSTAGAHVAARLGFAFVDLDERVGVERLVRDGLVDFRLRECAALTEALALGPVVIAAGAGIVDAGPARDQLTRACCIALDVDVDTALARIPDGTRPWLPPRAPAADESARRTAWLARESERPARRATLVDGRVVDARGPLHAVVDGIEAAVRSAPLCLTFAAEPTSAAAIGDGYVIADAAVAPRLRRIDHVVLDGARKDAGRLFELLAVLAAGGVGRNDRVVVVGGGALLDVAGLAAGLHHRGTSWVAVPTTLLAMVDAALGGKTAVDVAVDGVVVRNGAGLFHNPQIAVVDRAFLSSLSAAQIRHGRAEMLKHALLLGDDAAAEVAVDGQLDDEALQRTRAVKRFIVERDPRETWLRMALNLGHTFAHAFESRFGWAHGDAVLLGLRCALRASVAVGGLDRTVAQAADEQVKRLAVPYATPWTDDDVDALLTAMRRDKKARDGIRLVLLAKPGRPVLGDVADDVIVEVLRGAMQPDAV